MSYRNIANRLRPVLVGVCLTMSFGLASAQNGFDRKAWLNDYATLKQGLEKRYSILPGSDLSKVESICRASIAELFPR